MMNSRILLLAGLALLTTLANADSVQTHESAPTTTAIAGEWQPLHSAHALVSAQQRTMLFLPFAVRILSLPVEPGARIESGQTLVTLDAPQLRRQLSAWQLARHEHALASRQLKVLRRNRREKTITQRELLAGEQAAAKAEAREEQAWQALSTNLDLLHQNMKPADLAKQVDASGLSAIARKLGQLKAPFAGIVTARPVALGEQLAANAPILELESLERVYLDVGVAEYALPDWRQGQSYVKEADETITLHPLSGVPRFDADSGLWLLRFIAQNPGYRLRDGAWIEVQHLGSRRPVAWLPKQAVVSRNGREWVIVSTGDRSKPVEVRAGPPTTDGRIPVLEGIAPGTRVVVEGAYELLYRDLKDLIKFVD